LCTLHAQTKHLRARSVRARRTALAGWLREQAALLTDANGLPLAVPLTAGRRHGRPGTARSEDEVARVDGAAGGVQDVDLPAGE